MWQIILTGIIVAAAAAIVLYRLLRFLVRPQSKCESCGMNCTGCPVDELRKKTEREPFSYLGPSKK
jgi:ferredoxin